MPPLCGNSLETHSFFYRIFSIPFVGYASTSTAVASFPPPLPNIYGKISPKFRRLDTAIDISDEVFVEVRFAPEVPYVDEITDAPYIGAGNGANPHKNS